ncbi:FKBP-type peptidyl-prolyl cis-trans isomerase N-terminal domain-containing protein, partial [Oleiphilus sp. HI0123]
MSDLDLSTNEAKASYGVGLQMGQQLANVFNGLSLEAAIAGINDAFSGKGPQIPGEEINAAFQVIQTQVEAEKQEQAKKFAGEGEAFLAENAKRDEVTVLESGLQYEVITAGEGDIPTAESVV